MQQSTKPTILFAHANGFPGRTYQQLFTFLKSDFQINYLENIGHQTSYPVGSNWEFLALELQDYIEQNFERPIIGVGHSLGGVLHLITALKRPELYQQLIILDSPLYPPFKSFLLKQFKKWGLMHYITPSRTSARRRNLWPTAEIALDYF